MIVRFVPFFAFVELFFGATGTGIWWSLDGLNRRMVLFVATFINFLLLIYSPHERGYWLLRDWLYVEDNCRAIGAVLHKGIPGTIYNVGRNNELSNIDLIHLFLHALAAQTGVPEEDYTRLITFVPDRLGHDRRYALDSGKLCSSLDWAAGSPFMESLAQSVSWLRGSW